MFMWCENSFLKYEFGCSFSLSDNSYYSQEFPSILFSPHPHPLFQAIARTVLCSLPQGMMSYKKEAYFLAFVYLGT